MERSSPFEGWAIVELLGHRRLAGFVREVTLAGAGMLRVDFPADDPQAGFEASQFYPPSSLYCLTPTTEATARAVAKSARPEPVRAWEIRTERMLPATVPDTGRDAFEQEDHDGDGDDDKLL